MKNRNGPKGPGASLTRPTEAVRPSFTALGRLPETAADLFLSIGMTVTQDVQQPHPDGKGSPRTQHYALPWPDFESWRDARLRLNHFEKTCKAKVIWAPFNDSTSNDGPMSLNAYPGRAFIERVTNEGDANIDLMFAQNGGEPPASPHLAVERWFGLPMGALASAEDDKVRDLAKKTVTVAAFVGDPKDPKDCVLDARDFGIGLTGTEMPGTILSLNRGLKKTKPYLTGKHGQGASSTYQYSDLTLIASRKLGATKVAFTLVEGSWDEVEGGLAKTPTYRYLTIAGMVPEVELPEADFPHGTLVRHIGYMASDLFSPFGENSLYGLLMRSLAEPLLPVWLDMYNLRDEGKEQGYPTFRGYRRYGRSIRGTVNSLERAWKATLQAAEQAEDEGGKILHRASEYFDLPSWDFGARTGVVNLGKVRINYWVADPKGRTSQDVLRNWVDPDKTIVMTLDGQTHAEESRTIITGQRGAKLWAAGRFMVVQIDCNDLDPRAKYELFTSTREHAKETPIKKMILEELVRRLSFDTKLQDLNVQLAAADIKQTDDDKEQISSLIKKYLKAAGLSFEAMTRKVEKWTEVEEDEKAPVVKKELAPIEAVEPPTFVHWRFRGTSVSLHPGQRYSFLFETDASPAYWNPSDQSNSRIKVTARGVHYLGAGEMLGGRVRCHFECPEDARIGDKLLIQVQLDYAPGKAITSPLIVDVVAKPTPRSRPGGPPSPEEPDPAGDKAKIIKVKVRKKDFTEVDIPVIAPVPVKMVDTAWATLGWPHDPHKVGFSIRQVGGKIHLYYNAEFPPFLDMKRRMSKKSLEEEFIRRFEMKLILHTIFSLNYDFVDEDDFQEDQKKRIRNLLCATAESLALATKAELEIEAKIKSEDTGPVDTAVASNLQTAASDLGQDLVGSSA
ncbi:MAG: hypothetical protein WC731_06375 [Candidatus Omnitrophota bacterium]